MALIAAHLNAGVILVVTETDRQTDRQTEKTDREREGGRKREEKRKFYIYRRQ